MLIERRDAGEPFGTCTDGSRVKRGGLRKRNDDEERETEEVKTRERTSEGCIVPSVSGLFGTARGELAGNVIRSTAALLLRSHRRPLV